MDPIYLYYISANLSFFVLFKISTNQIYTSM